MAEDVEIKMAEHALNIKYEIRNSRQKCCPNRFKNNRLETSNWKRKTVPHEGTLTLSTTTLQKNIIPFHILIQEKRLRPYERMPMPFNWEVFATVDFIDFNTSNLVYVVQKAEEQSALQSDQWTIFSLQDARVIWNCFSVKLFTYWFILPRNLLTAPADLFVAFSTNFPSLLCTARCGHCKYCLI